MSTIQVKLKQIKVYRRGLPLYPDDDMRKLTALVLICLLFFPAMLAAEPFVTCQGCCTDDHCADCYITIPDKSEALTSQNGAELNNDSVLLITEDVLPKPAFERADLAPELIECCFAVDKRGHPSLGPPQA